MGSLAIGIDLGGTQIRVAVIDEKGGILRRDAVSTDAMGGPVRILDQMEELAKSLIGDINPGLVVGVGLSAPGPLDTKAGIALDIPTLAGFVDFPLAAELQKRFRYPITVENDGIAAAFGEWRFGAGRGVENMVYVTVSTGIGGGVILDNRIVHGRKGMAGHVGHMSIVPNGEPCLCGNRGCFEAYGSGTAFTKRARERVLESRETTLGRTGVPIDSAAVFEAARNGDGLAIALVAEEAEILGRGFVSLIHLFSPDILVMGGGVSSEFDMLRSGINSHITHWAMPAFRDVKVVRSALSQNSGLVGAAALAFLSDKQDAIPPGESLH